MTQVADRPASSTALAVALEGGPMAGQWFWPEDWAAFREAATRRAANGQQRSPALDYAPTRKITHNPIPRLADLSGTVWAYQSGGGAR